MAMQTAHFSFDMGAERNKGLAYYHCMFCAENRQILAIVDWPGETRYSGVFMEVTARRDTVDTVMCVQRVSEQH